MPKASRSASHPATRPETRTLRGSNVPAVVRATSILRFLADSDEALGVQAIARAMNLIPSTCLHLLRTLVAQNLVAFDGETKRYRLDAGVLTLARSWMRQNPFGKTAQPTLVQLSRTHAVSVLAVQIHGLDHMVVVNISPSAQILNPHAEIGSRFPALVSATGRCVAAFGGHSWDELARRFPDIPWQHPPSLAAWRREVEAARTNGYAIDAGNFLVGLTILSAPVFDLSGNLRHAIATVGISEQLPRAKLDLLAQDLREAAQRLSLQMGAA